MEARRPDPDALLERVQEQQDARTRGRLKIFFGASPGVGKTFAMLEAAQRRKKEGVDVLVGWVETHGRAETAALLENLERLPPRPVEYRGTLLHEFDLDAALARRPALLLLDELAHTNAPGSRHAKRWQDTQELLDHGIDVWTTLNVQHVESLNDLVARVTDVTVRETVPDGLLDEADEVEFVDLPPDDLLQRLREGKVYIPEQAQRAAGGFFRKGNLIALRELALRRTAEHVDEVMRDYRRAHEIEETWPVAERVLVCVRPNPESGRLVRAAHRLASRLHGDLIVGYVETPSQPALSDGEKQSLAATLKLADQLGARTAVLSGQTVGEAVLSYARANNVSKIVVGKPARARWRDRVFGSPVEAIIRGSDEIDVYAIAGEGTAPPPGEKPAPRPPVAAGGLAWAVVATLACSALGWVLFPRVDRANIIMLYLAGVALVAVRFGRWPSVLSACLSVAAFDVMFVPPYWTFAVTDTQYLIMFAVMLAVALLISTLAVRLRDQAEAARQRERRTHALYALSRELAGLTAPGDVSSAVCRHVADLFHGPALVLLPDAEGTLHTAGDAAATTLAGESRERAVADWVFRHGRRAGLGTDTLPGASGLYVPLPGGSAPLGVLGVRPDPSLLPLTPEHLDLLETLARLVAAPLERARLAEDAERARVEMEAERLRNTLLSSVSHDLRTPLAAITGAASSLLDADTVGEAERQELTQTIYEEGERLDRLVGNLLDMTRLESGRLRLQRDWHSAEELIGGALARMEKALARHRVSTSVPADLLVSVDALLIERVLVNLLDNAVKYTPPGARIWISAAAAPGAVEFEVADDGPGLPPGQEEKVFEKFFRASSPQRRGFGLGLAICRAIVMAHGGRIHAQNRAGGGVGFRFTLPLEGTPPAAPAAEGDDDDD